MALDQKKTMHVAELTVLIKTFLPVLYIRIKVSVSNLKVICLIYQIAFMTIKDTNQEHSSTVSRRELISQYKIFGSLCMTKYMLVEAAVLSMGANLHFKHQIRASI